MDCPAALVGEGVKVSPQGVGPVRRPFTALD